jgi:hypothetical protein
MKLIDLFLIQALPEEEITIAMGFVWVCLLSIDSRLARLPGAGN